MSKREPIHDDRKCQCGNNGVEMFDGTLNRTVTKYEWFKVGPDLQCPCCPLIRMGEALVDDFSIEDLIFGHVTFAKRDAGTLWFKELQDRVKPRRS